LERSTIQVLALLIVAYITLGYLTLRWFDIEFISLVNTARGPPTGITCPLHCRGILLAPLPSLGY
jgi:hypothetical protein